MWLRYYSDDRPVYMLECKKCGKKQWGTRLMQRATKEQKQAEYERLKVIAEKNGYAKGWISHKYKDAFGVWPRGINPQ
jgi:hypothetical protein